MSFPHFPLKETDESLSFDEMILEAAKSIAAATSALVKAASAAQRELIDIGKVNIWKNTNFWTPLKQLPYDRYR